MARLRAFMQTLYLERNKKTTQTNGMLIMPPGLEFYTLDELTITDTI